MQDKMIEKVLSVYNDRLKKLRSDYMSNQGIPNYYRYILIFAPILLCAFLVLCFKISISMIIITMVFLIIIYFVIYFFKKDKSYHAMNNYLVYLKTCGFKSIEEFENTLNKYVLNGNYSNDLLEHYMEEYGIDDTTSIITDLDKNKFYVWSDDYYFYLLPINSNSLNMLKKIKLGDIYYFRKDKISTIVKCYTDVLLFDIFAYDKINSLIGDKKFENIINFEPDSYISDFELYMHNCREDKETNFVNLYRDGGLGFKIFISIILIGCLCAFCILFDKTSDLLVRACLIGIFTFLCLNLNKLTDLLSLGKGNGDIAIEDIANENKTKLMFRELKVALGVFDDYDKVYTNDNACYLCWVKNGYFHVFLNQIYYNCVFIVIGLKDIDCYYVSGNEVILKSKVKTLTFRKDAKELFDKILPNKDYDWLNSLKK